MSLRVESSEFYSRVDEEEKNLIEGVVGMVLKVVSGHEWHGSIALVGGRLNKHGKRKDTDIKVIVSSYSYADALTKAIEQEVIYTFAHQRLGNEFNFKTALYLNDPYDPVETPIHLILPTHEIGPNTLKSAWPWDKSKKYSVLAEF